VFPEAGVKTFPSAKIRNVALVGHGHSGKTTLTEALLFANGLTQRMGRVEDGNTVSDFDPEEHKRGISTNLSIIPIEYEGHKLNILDTPGYADFIGDVAAAMRVADLVLFVISGVEGVEVQAEIIWKMAEQAGIPRAFFINKLDRDRASFSRTCDDLKNRFGAGVAPLQLPIGEEAGLVGVVDLLTDKAYTYADGRSTQGEVPDGMEEQEHAVHDALVEGIVVADDDLMERYLGDEAIDYKELAGALAKGIAAGSVFPVLCGSATQLIGIDRLCRFIADEAPPPSAKSDGPPAAFVFKTIADPYVGRVNVFKVMSGKIQPDAVLTNGRTVADERLHQLLTLRGREQEPASEVPAGDIAAVAKLNDTSTGDILAQRGADIAIEPFQSPEPVLPVAIKPKSKADEDKLANALHRLQDEDPVLRIDRNAETHQTLMWGIGETHISIALEKLARKFGVEVETEDVKVAYRETVSTKGEAEGKYKKQTGGHGQFGVAFLRVEPKERGGGFEFSDEIVGGAIPRQFIPAVEKGIVDTITNGGALGFPVVDVKVTCYDGKYHPVDSSEMSFKMAGSLGFREAAAKAKPVLLEPVSELTITVPEAYQGDVMGDLNSKRGRIMGTEAVGNGEQEITAQVPTSEVIRYAIDLRSLTGGRGRFTAQHSHYDPAPPNLADKIVAAAAAAKEG
jgi:elongation factor G